MPIAKAIDTEALAERATPKQAGLPRNREIYISESVYWCLTMKAKALEQTACDQFADDILRQWCRENLPELVKLREQRDSLYEQQKEIDKLAIKTTEKQQKV